MNDRTSEYASELFGRIGEEKRVRILDTAIKEFARNGFNGANVNRIAEDAGISIGSLYKYFQTKDDLFMCIVDESSKVIKEYTGAIVDSDGDLLIKIEKLLRMAYDYSLDYPDLIKLYDVFTSDNDEKRAALLAEKLEGVTSKAYRELIQKAQKKGEIRDDVDAGILAFMIDNQLMMTQFSYANSYYERRMSLYLGAKDKDEIDIDELIKNIMRALKEMLMK